MAEKEYIELNEAVKACEDYFKDVCVYDVASYEAVNDFERILDSIPVVDVAPVKHGHWIDKPYPNYPAHDIRYCSECGWNIHKSKLRNSDLNWSYCPNCGAKMDKDGD